jgi:DNA-binding transcriptional LysR family regulator
MDRFRAIQVFVEVAERGGFAAAARELAMSPPAVTRAISALEERIGARLLVRTTRSVRLTEAGARFLEDGQRVLMDLQAAEDAAIGSHGTPRGELRITAPMLFGRLYVTPILGDFLDLYPEVSCQTLFLDRSVSLMDEGLDIAVRIGELPDSSLTAIRVGSVRWVTFAAPDYLETHGTPEHPRDLKAHKLMQSVSVSGAREWAFLEDGRPFQVKIEPRLRMNTNDAVVALAVRGWGISRLLSYQIAPDVAAGRLRAVLEKFEAPAIPIHVVHQEGRMASPKVRSCVDYLVERLRATAAIRE